MFLATKLNAYAFLSHIHHEDPLRDFELLSFFLSVYISKCGKTHMKTADVGFLCFYRAHKIPMNYHKIQIAPTSENLPFANAIYM